MGDRTPARAVADLLRPDDSLEEVSDRNLMLLLAKVEHEIRDRNENRPPPPAWRPWTELRQRWPRTVFGWYEMTGHRGLCVPLGDGHTEIRLHPALTWRQIRETLTHELTHDDRQGFYTSKTDRQIVDAEEAAVRAITRERMRSYWAGTPGPSIGRVCGEPTASPKVRVVRRARGSVRELSPGRWEMRVYVGKDPDTGRSKYVSRVHRGSRESADQAMQDLVKSLGRPLRSRRAEGTASTRITPRSHRARPGGRSARRHLPFEPLRARATSLAVLAEQIGVTTRTLHRWARTGVPEISADRAATALDLHPFDVWGEAWWP